MNASPLLRAMTLGIGLAFTAGTLAACDDDKPAEQASEKADDTGKTMESSSSTMEEKTEKAVDMAKDAANDAGAKISEGAEVAAEEVEKAADAVKEAAQEAGEQIGEKVDDAMDKTGDKMIEAGDAMKKMSQ